MPHLVRVWVVDGHQAHVVDECVREVIPGRGDADVDLTRQIRQHRVALAKVGDHVIDLCG